MTLEQIKQNLIQKATEYQNFVESNKSYAPIPNLSPGRNTLEKVVRFVPQMGIDIANTIVGKGILNPVSDTTRQVVGAIAGAATLGGIQASRNKQDIIKGAEKLIEAKDYNRALKAIMLISDQDEKQRLLMKLPNYRSE